MAEFHGDKSKIDACMVLQERANKKLTKDEFEYYSATVEPVLSVRLPDETFRGLINFTKIVIRNTPTDEIEKALVSKQQICFK